MLCRIAPEKRCEVFVEAVRQLPAPWRGLLVGAANYWTQEYGSIIEQAVSSTSGKVLLVPPVENVGDYYRAMDAMVVCSSAEGFLLTAVEAGVCRVPVVSPLVPALEDASRRYGHVMFWQLPENPLPEQVAVAVQATASEPELSRRRAALWRMIARREYSMERHIADWRGVLSRYH